MDKYSKEICNTVTVWAVAIIIALGICFILDYLVKP